MRELLITVMIFLRTDCPVSNAYAPELTRLAETYAPRGIAFRLVFPDSALTSAQVEAYRKEYGLTIPATLDPGRALTTGAQVRVTPEAAVFRDGKLLYHGRVDNRYLTPGKRRPSATSHDLELVLEALLAGHPAPFSHRPATGCAINDLPEPARP